MTEIPPVPYEPMKEGAKRPLTHTSQAATIERLCELRARGSSSQQHYIDTLQARYQRGWAITGKEWDQAAAMCAALARD